MLVPHGRRPDWADSANWLCALATTRFDGRQRGLALSGANGQVWVDKAERDVEGWDGEYPVDTAAQNCGCLDLNICQRGKSRIWPYSGDVWMF